MDTKLYVGNMSLDTTEQDLRTMFSEVGTVGSVDIIMDRQTGKSKGFAFVIMGNEAEKALDLAGITVNKNGIPFDPNPPLKPSGIRIGSPAVTPRGMKETEMELIAGWITMALHHRADESAIARIREEVYHLTDQFPIPE